MNKEKRRTAFTLAETLIALGIIGIVAVTVMPTLIQKYQEKSWTTSAMVFQRKLEESLKVMNTQGVIGQRGTTENFFNQFRQYIKITRTCKENELTNCFTNEFASVVKDYDNEAQNTRITKSASALANSLKAKWQNDVLGVDFANGVSAVMVYNKNCQGDQFSNVFEGTSCLSGYIDVNGSAKPNELGKDIFTYGSAAATSVPSMKFAGKTWSSPFKPEPLSLAECEKLADEGYGFNKSWCTNIDNVASVKDKNYFAGVVKACGGTSNMPTSTDLQEFAKTIYPWDIMQNYNESNGTHETRGAYTNKNYAAYCPNGKSCRYADRVSEFVIGSNNFGIYSKSNNNDNLPYVHYYSSTRTVFAPWRYHYKEYDSISLGICEVK